MSITKHLVIHLFFLGSLFVSTAAVAQTSDATSIYAGKRHLLGLSYGRIFQDNRPDYGNGVSGYYKGFSVGASYEYLLTKNISLISGLRYQRVVDTYLENEVTQESLRIPFGFRHYFLSVGQKLRVYTELTGSLNFSEIGSAIDVGLGADLKVGLTYDLTKRLRLSTDFGATYDSFGGIRLRQNFGLQLKF